MKKHEVTFQLTLCVETDVPDIVTEEAFKLMIVNRFEKYLMGTPKVFKHHISKIKKPCVNPV